MSPPLRGTPRIAWSPRPVPGALISGLIYQEPVAPGPRLSAQQPQDGGAVRPVSRGPFRKRPCIERVDAPLPARRPTEAYPLR